MNKNKYYLVIASIIGMTLLGLWLKNFSFDVLLTSIRNINYTYIIAAVLFYMSAYFIRSVRWNLLLGNQVKVTLKESWLVSSAGNWINYLIPVRAGELIRAILIKRTVHISAVAVLPSIFIDKFFDTLGIFFVLLLIPLINVNISKGMQVIILLLITIFFLIFGILVLSVLHKRSITRILQTLFAWLPRKLSQKINNLIEIFVNGLNIFEHRRRIIVYCLLFTAIGILMDGLYFFCIFKAFHLGAGFLVVLFGYTLINLSYVLPQPPAQLGSNEWMMIIIFSLGFGFDRNIASSIMVFAHLFTACIITVMGIIGFSYAGIKSLKQIQREL